MRFLIIIILSLFVLSASGSPIYSGEETVLGNGVVIGHSEGFWASGSNLNKISNQVYTDGAAGHNTLTAPGPVQYQTKQKLDATKANVYTSTSIVSFKNGGISSDSASMSDYAPNQTDISCTAGNIGVVKSGVIVGNVASSQYASGEKTFIGQNATVQSAKFINDADYDFSGQADWNESGMYLRDFSASSKTGATKNSTTPQYENYVRNHYGSFTDSDGNMSVRSDSAWGDFSSNFVTKSENITANQTEQ